MTRSQVSIIFESLLFFIIDAVAIVGNTFVILAITRNPALQNITHWHIASLAIADWLMAVTCMPLSLGVTIKGQWIYGGVVCQIQGHMINIWGSFTLMMVSVTAVNRYYRVVRPARYKKIFTKKFALVIAIVCLAASTMLSLGIIFLGKGWFQFRPHSFCIPAFPNPTVLKVILLPCFLIFIVTPLAVLLFCYFKVYRVVYQHSLLVAPSLRSAQSQQQNFNTPSCRVDEVNVTKMIFAIVVVFCVLWIPVCIIGVLYVCGFNLPRWSHLLYDYFLFISAATNPLIYGLLNRSFRNEYVKILGCKRI